MTISQIKLWMTFCCSHVMQYHVMQYHVILAVVESKKFEKGNAYWQCTWNKQVIGLMYLRLLCCWFWKRKSLFVLILSKLVYESLLLFSDIMLKLKKMGFCWKSKLPELFCIWVDCSTLFHFLAKSNETLFSFKLFYCYLDLWEG